MAYMGAGRGAYRVFVGRREGKYSLAKPRRRWEDNIEINLQKVEWRGLESIDRARDRDRWQAFVNVVMNVQVP
jgi:hypothetical protein